MPHQVYFQEMNKILIMSGLNGHACGSLPKLTFLVSFKIVAKISKSTFQSLELKFDQHASLTITPK